MTRRRITFLVDEGDYVLFRKFCDSKHDSMSRLLERCVRAMGKGKFKFSGWDITFEGADGKEVRVVVDEPSAPPQVVVPVSKEITVSQYRKFVEEIRMGDSGFPTYPNDDLESWIGVYVAEKGYDEKSLRQYIMEYPPNLGHIGRKKTDKFLGLGV